MSQPVKKEASSEVRVVVEVDGKPVGFLSLDMDRLWPLINHHKREAVPIEWIDSQRFQDLVRSAVARNLMNRLQSHLYETLGSEMVRAELDVESFTLKAETAAQTFGHTRQEIDDLVSESGRTAADFYAFFWDYLMNEQEPADLKKKWKAAKRAEGA